MQTDLAKFQDRITDATLPLMQIERVLHEAGIYVMAADPLSVGLTAIQAQADALKKSLADMGMHLSNRQLFGKEEGA